MSQGNDLTVENLLLTVQNISVDGDDECSVENNTNLITHINEDEEEEDDDDDEMAVWLGSVEELKHDWSLLLRPDVSIAGGFPVWLDPINLPSGSSTICGICGDPLQFLLQVYAPVCEKKSAFHRTLFIFMCLSMKCLLQDQHEQRKHPLDNASRSCIMQLVQDLERMQCLWQLQKCTLLFQEASVASNTIWPQFKIDMEAEPEGDTMSENGGYATALASAGHVDEEFNSLLDSFEADVDQKSWATFQERVSRVPEQVLRYCRDARARPLWPMSSVRPSKTDIPKCCYCGGPRCFELQILPQLLYYFGVENDVNSLDWSTIVIYTCEASCDGSMAYKEEFPWVQLPQLQHSDTLR